MALQAVWLVAITLAAMFCTYMATPNAVRFLNKSVNDPVVKPSQSINRLLISGLVVLAVALALFAALGIAILILSTIAFALGTFGYYAGRRYAGKLERIPDVGTRLLLSGTLFALVSTELCLVLFVYWTLFLLPIVIWLLVGLLATEAAINERIRRAREHGSTTDRSRAIVDINYNQNRGNPTSPSNRYPFP